MTPPVTVQLRRPISAHGEQLQRLEFREPRPSDVAAAGYPLSVSAEGSVPQAEAINALIVRLAQIPASSVEQLSMPDWSDCMGAVLGFFGASEPEPTSSIERSISPGSGA